MLKIVATEALLSDFFSLSGCVVLPLRLLLADEAKRQHCTTASTRYPIISWTVAIIRSGLGM
jgi:hypothetical protein